MIHVYHGYIRYHFGIPVSGPVFLHRILRYRIITKPLRMVPSIPKVPIQDLKLDSSQWWSSEIFLELLSKIFKFFIIYRLKFSIFRHRLGTVTLRPPTFLIILFASALEHNFYTIFNKSSYLIDLFLTFLYPNKFQFSTKK